MPGGNFDRDNNTAYPAMVSGFLLDRFEVTVGRFRKFVEAYPGSKPAPGVGEHARIEGSGWNAEGDIYLPADAAALKVALKCEQQESSWTWMDNSGDNEYLPINCLNWYVAFAFCAWDGGRLATEEEWNYAAAGGDEQRTYPWSNPADSTAIDDTYASYKCMGDGSAVWECAFSDVQSVGSRSPKGDGKWGQADLAGNLWEWVLDGFAEYPSHCNNCANIATVSRRVLRGGSRAVDESFLLSSRRHDADASGYYNGVGARCARTP
ncbi:formylglycine-generating enzyme family protein [Sorangium sp. So ce1153]|uniref:formylglycine-generating enzyme family protein n=1 Tax=Sorangium sp. So ce1153 TaxID=3133333 RepID=UPI003F627D97